MKGRDIKSWEEMAACADHTGVIPEAVYRAHSLCFPVCPPQNAEARRRETEIWTTYLSTTRRGRKKSSMYRELFRYEWYEGRKRTGFWGNIEAAIKRLNLGAASRITIFSAGSGRDLLKVGLAAGVFTSCAGKRIAGTHKEIDVKYMRLAKPEARILLTEFEEHNLASLSETVDSLIDAGALTPEMVTVRRWDFRQAAPLVCESQDLCVFSLTGNYAAASEQPLMLREIARCVRPGGHLVASAMTERLDFKKARSLRGKVRLILGTPLAWPVAFDFAPWQARWGKMAAEMYNLGFWKNASAKVWMSFLEPAQMEQVAIYPGPSTFLPVEVLLARKKAACDGEQAGPCVISEGEDNE